MTIYKPLECTITERGYCITATMKQEKFSTAWSYEIHVSKADYSIATDVIKCAKTTWKKKYREAITAWS